jgi:hypothetical protein
MSYQFYLILHFCGIFLILMSLSGICFHMASGGTREWPLRKFAAMLHGLGLVIALVAGFGLLAKLGMMKGLPTWAIGKLVIWLILGGLPALLYRKKQMAKSAVFLILALALLAGGLAAYKPGMQTTAPESAPATAPAPVEVAPSTHN